MTRLLCMHGGTYPKPSSLDPRVKESLGKYASQCGLEVEWVDTSDNFQVYADELDKRWNGEEDIIVVEQDKEVFSDTLSSFLKCQEPWCSYTYWINPDPHTTLVLGGFGVTRFSAYIQRLVPVSEFRGPGQISIDRRFYDLLVWKHGIGCHLHGHVVHHHTYEPRPLSVRQHVSRLRSEGIIAPAIYPPAIDPGLLPGSYRLE